MKNFIGQSKPDQAPYYAKKTSGPISKETKREFPDIKVIKSDSVTLNGYSLPVEDKLYIKSREMELKKELKDLNKELKSIHRHDLATAALIGVAVIGAFAAATSVGIAFGQCAMTGGLALLGGGGLVAGLASGIAHEEWGNGDTKEGCKKELAQNYDNGRIELDHLKKSEIYWPGENRELTPREKCLSTLKELKKDTVKVFSRSCDELRDELRNEGASYSTRERLETFSYVSAASESVDDFFKKKYPGLYEGKNDKHSDEYYERLFPEFYDDVINFRKNFEPVFKGL